MGEKEKAVEILENDKLINHSCAVLMAAKQLYSLARYTIHEQLVAEYGAKEENDEVESFIVEAMNHKADVPFRRDELLEKVRQLAVPYLIDEIQRELKSEETKLRVENAQKQIYRGFRDLTIPINDGIHLDPAITTVVHGPQAAEKLEECFEFLKNKNEHRVMFFSAGSFGLSEMPTKRKRADHLELPRSVWVSRMSSDTKVTKNLEDFEKYMNLTPDVLIVSDLSLAGVVSYKSLSSRIAKLRRYCNKRKCALVVGLNSAVFLHDELQQAENDDTWLHRNIIKLDQADEQDQAS